MFKKPFQTIVVGVDFSVYSRLVVSQAFRLANYWKSQVILVHALNEPLEYIPTPLLAYQKFPKFKTYKSRIKEFYNIKDKKNKIIVGYDTPTLLIQYTAKINKNPLIMVGYAGNSKVAEFLLGSTARNLALKGSFPVWVQRGSKIVDPLRILVPVDLSRSSSRAIDVCQDLGLIQPLKYQVFFVRSKPLPILDYSLYGDTETVQLKKVQEGFKKLFSLYPRISFQSTTGDITEKIVQKSKDFDLIVMSRRRPRRVLTVSETSYLMSLSEIPLIVV